MAHRHSIQSTSGDDARKHSLVLGGMFQALARRIPFLTGGTPGTFRKAAAAALVAWLPLAVLTAVEGTFSGGAVRLPFLDDFVTHIRFLLVVPFFVLMERFVDPAYDRYVRSTEELVEEDTEIRYHAIARRAGQLAGSVMPDLLFLILVYGVFAVRWRMGDLPGEIWAIRNLDGQTTVSWAGSYFLLVSFPLYQLLVIRWVWRWCIWTYTAVSFARLDLQIEASHGDRMAGLGYLGHVPTLFGVLSLGLAAILSAEIGSSAISGGASLQTFLPAIGAFVLLTPVVLFCPLLTFMPLLTRTKVRGIYTFGSLVQHHNVLFRKKWLEARAPGDQSTLGSQDNSSMADINGSYAAVFEMNVVPFRLIVPLSLSLGLLIPFLPLLGIIYSPAEIASMLAKIVMG